MKMRKLWMTAAVMALLGAGGIGAASAAPSPHAPQARHEMTRHETHRPMVTHERLVASLRAHHYRVLGNPYFAHGHYVVRTHDRFGHVVFVQIDPYTGAFLGEIRL